MNDNILAMVDARRFDVSADHTPEGALLHGAPPLVDCSHGVDKVIFMRRVMAVAREYVVDYDLVRASARAGIEWDLVKCLERDPTFIVAVDVIRRELTPEQIVTRTEVMDMLKREATTAAKARDRVAAIKELARIAGFVTADDVVNPKNTAPVININLNGVPQERPTINVTAAPMVITGGEELL